jgi:hypothetical protein
MPRQLKQDILKHANHTLVPQKRHGLFLESQPDLKAESAINP